MKQKETPMASTSTFTVSTPIRLNPVIKPIDAEGRGRGPTAEDAPNGDIGLK